MDFGSIKRRRQPFLQRRKREVNGGEKRKDRMRGREDKQELPSCCCSAPVRFQRIQGMR